ncbi:MAG TPA: ABC transporter permease, partial [Acidobacteriota bacterium]
VELLRLAWDTMRSHRLRSLLVVLGVAIGTATLMGMVSVILGLQTKLEDEIRSAERVVLYVVKYDVLVERHDEQLRRRPNLRPEDADALKSALPEVQRVDFQIENQPRFRFQHGSEKARNGVVFANTPEGMTIYNLQIDRGRYFNDLELDRSERVAVLGAGPARDLFPLLDPLGKRLRINGIDYRVIGTFAPRKSLFGSQADNFVSVPYSTYLKDLSIPRFEERRIAIEPRPGTDIEKLTLAVTAIMRLRRNIPLGQPLNFAVVSSDSVQDLLDKITGPMALVLTIIASIGLMVGGIGVIAIMLVSVTERTREIGIRRALGARRMEVLWQFLIEAASLTGLGGVLGVLAGLGLAQLAGRFLELPVATPWGWTALAVAVSAGCGILFGMYPATRAAGLDPVEALRYE